MNLERSSKNNERYIVALATVNLLIAFGVDTDSRIALYGMSISPAVLESAIRFALMFFIVWHSVHVLHYYLGQSTEVLGRVENRYISEQRDSDQACEPPEGLVDRWSYVPKRIYESKDAMESIRKRVGIILTQMSPVAPLVYGVLSYFSPNAITNFLFLNAGQPT